MVPPQVTIGSLPDDVLLAIFYAYYKESHNLYYRSWCSHWLTLVHVCRRWRSLTFGSPHRLDLQLLCTPTRPVRKMLDIWPALPLVIDFYDYTAKPSDGHFDNLIAALERRDRVHEICVGDLPGFVWEQIITMAEEPFPALTTLVLAHHDGLAVGDIFLNGSAPNLQLLALEGISIPRRLGSATHLTFLRLSNIPNSGYIPPETMATSLSALPHLESLAITFQSPTPQPKRRHRPVPPRTRFVLPSLTQLKFRGVSEYLEVLTTRIDAPLLEGFDVAFFNQLIFEIPQIIRFFGHQDLFRPSSLSLHIDLAHGAYIDFSGPPARYRMWDIRCKKLDWQVFSMAQICNQIPFLRSSVESLHITFSPHSDSSPEGEIDPTLWYQLFHSFTSVQSLEISQPLIPAVLPPLTEQSAADILPSLHSLSVLVLWGMDMSEETAQQVIRSFVAARQQSGRPLTVSHSEST